MAQNTTVKVGEDWVQLTDANITDITFQVQRGRGAYIVATIGAVAPTDHDGALVYKKGEGERNAALADVWPGLAGGNRVYARCVSGVARIMVSHA